MPIPTLDGVFELTQLSALPVWTKLLAKDRYFKRTSLLCSLRAGAVDEHHLQTGAGIIIGRCRRQCSEADCGRGAPAALPVGSVLAPERLRHSACAELALDDRALRDAREARQVHLVERLGQRYPCLLQVEPETVVAGHHRLERRFFSGERRVGGGTRRVVVGSTVEVDERGDVRRTADHHAVDGASHASHAGGQGAVREVDRRAGVRAGERTGGAEALVVDAGLAAEVGAVAGFATVLHVIAADRSHAAGAAST